MLVAEDLKECVALLNRIDLPKDVFWMGCMKDEDIWSITHLAGEMNGSYLDLIAQI